MTVVEDSPMNLRRITRSLFHPLETPARTGLWRILNGLLIRLSAGELQSFSFTARRITSILGYTRPLNFFENT